MKFDFNHFLIKITSRKFLLSLGTTVTMLLIALGSNPDTTERYVSLALSALSAIIFIVVEGGTDYKKIALLVLETLAKLDSGEDEFTELNEPVEKVSLSESGTIINHAGTIKVEGVNNKDELTGVVDIVTEQLRKEVR
jgi:hypothetical protein